ncbi:MAG: phosphoglycerate dehydrogenase [Sporomusaceae bacterium]|nr:phosphoglycerate dehydrogenase [Sporomusaceae bacterium]
MKILISEKIADKGVEKLVQEGATVHVLPNLSREELLAKIGEYDGLIIRSITQVNDELLEHAPNLKVVGRAGNGVDNIDVEAATRRGIIVVNTPESNIVSAAELTIGLLLASCRNIPRANDRVRGGSYDRAGLKGIELLGKTLAIVGFGKIGSLVATRLKAFGMHVIAYDPYISDARFKKFGVEKKETLEELMREADILTVHTPKTEETLGMIGHEQFKAAKRGLRVVNCARGGIIDEAALLEAMKEKIVASAAIDVLMSEPHPNTPLFDFDNVVFTPHSGADTKEAQDNVGVTIATEVISALRGEIVPNAVNLPTMPTQEFESYMAYLKLGETMGKLYYQWEKEAVEKVEITYSGEIGSVDTSAISLAVLKGILEPVLKEKVNYVNASLLAESRGISVIESRKSSSENYLNLLQIKVVSAKKTFTISGSVFGKGEMRIVQINGYTFDLIPKPCMLIAENIDRPGVVGNFGTLLGKNNVNIATMQLGLSEEEAHAMMIMTVDSPVATETVELLGQVDGILKVRFAKI